MPSHNTVQRVVPPRQGEELDDDDSAMSNEGPESGAEGDSVSGSEGEEDMGTSEDEDAADAQQQISNVSFSALKRAEDSLSRKRKREEDTTADQEEKLAALRQRLQQIKKDKTNSLNKSISKRKPSSAPAQVQQDGSGSDQDEDDSESPTSENEGTSRRSKHAPAMVSSKRQVTRKRQVVDVPKHVTRDPRFDALRQSARSNGNEEKAYSFLRDYQKSEMQELRAAIKATKDDDQKETLRRKLNSMENQAKTREAKEREREIVRKHRREEGEQVRQGKTPFFLKNSEIKQRALVDKFQSMKGKDREKLLERRRRKESQKEKRRMPTFRAPAVRSQ